MLLFDEQAPHHRQPHAQPPTSQSSNQRGCFNCGGNKSDCPDRHACHGKSKGYGKNLHTSHEDSHDTMAFYKGKSKSKGSGKMGHMMEFFNLNSKGNLKGNAKAKSQSKNRGNVNGYFHELQFDENSGSLQEKQSLYDCAHQKEQSKSLCIDLRSVRSHTDGTFTNAGS